MLRIYTALARPVVGDLSTIWIPTQSRRSVASRADTMQPGDRVLLQAKGKNAFMTKTLHPESTTPLPAGNVKHADIIGKRSRDTVRSSKGLDLRVYLPSLAEYTRLTPRMVTPVYHADANFIVSLLDINVDGYRPDSQEPPLEILEGGTGHGSLTLHLARAIHAANPPPDGRDHESTSNFTAETPIDRQNKQRQATIHTVDLSKHHSEHARKIVSGFRQGMYIHDIDFHVGDISDWIDEQSAARGLNLQQAESDETFLSHIILDLPSAHRHLAKAASALHANGSLIVFNPHITQITTVVQMVKEQYLPLQLERVVESGPNMTGGKEWDVRSVKTRARNQADLEEAARKAKQGAAREPEPVSSSLLGDFDAGASVDAQTADPGEKIETSPKRDEGWEMVCRPKVGFTVTGGGFVCHFKKMKW